MLVHPGLELVNEFSEENVSQASKHARETVLNSGSFFSFPVDAMTREEPAQEGFWDDEIIDYEGKTWHGETSIWQAKVDKLITKL